MKDMILAIERPDARVWVSNKCVAEFEPKKDGFANLQQFEENAKLVLGPCGRNPFKLGETVVEYGEFEAASYRSRLAREGCVLNDQYVDRSEDAFKAEHLLTGRTAIAFRMQNRMVVSASTCYTVPGTCHAFLEARPEFGTTSRADDVVGVAVRNGHANELVRLGVLGYAIGLVKPALKPEPVTLTVAQLEKHLADKPAPEKQSYPYAFTTKIADGAHRVTFRYGPDPEKDILFFSPLAGAGLADHTITTKKDKRPRSLGDPGAVKCSLRDCLFMLRRGGARLSSICFVEKKIFEALSHDVDVFGLPYQFGPEHLAPAGTIPQVGDRVLPKGGRLCFTLATRGNATTFQDAFGGLWSVTSFERGDCRVVARKWKNTF